MKKYRWWRLILSVGLSLLWITLGYFALQGGKNSAASAEPSTGSIYYFPLIFKSGTPSPLALTNAWTTNPEGITNTLYYIGDMVYYQTSGTNLHTEAITATLRWQQESPCGNSEIFNGAISLQSGEWTHVFSNTAPACVGTYTNTVQTQYNTYTDTKITVFDIHFPAGVVISTQQAFDKCALPTVGQMQTWWDTSPYVVHNIYIGGVHYACPSGTLNTAWVQAVAQQGWAFILTWVGLQAPCTTYAHRISSNTATAYSQGIDEAAAALAVADSIGLSGEKILYYDMESYAGADTSCRNAVKAFLQGWTDWIQLQDDKAGAYGSPCYYMTDWASNNPPPDDVWIASWLTPAQYRPDATVWNVACMNNNYWSGQRRLRQYAGGHVETWGGTAFSIDSNVLNGDITAITTAQSSLTVDPVALGVIREIDLISSSVGWALRDNTLLFTQDGGTSWEDISPDLGNAAILDAEFQDSLSGWLVALGEGADPWAGLRLFQTADGGQTWDASPLPAGDQNIAAASLDFLDSQIGWLSVKLQSSSNFSSGLLFATRDGGQTWEERSVPIGDPVHFVDELRGWTAGGPAGDQLFYTRDGGQTWQPQPLDNLPAGQRFFGLPEFATPADGLLPVTFLDSPRSGLILYKTNDGGQSWYLAESLPIQADPGTALPFSLSDQTWWAAPPEQTELLTSSNFDSNTSNLLSSNLPVGVSALDFASERAGWALVQEGFCQGDKIPYGQEIPSEAVPLQCGLATRLYSTQDGGIHWEEITP